MQCRFCRLPNGLIILPYKRADVKEEGMSASTHRFSARFCHLQLLLVRHQDSVMGLIRRTGLHSIFNLESVCRVAERGERRRRANNEGQRGAAHTKCSHGINARQRRCRRRRPLSPARPLLWPSLRRVARGLVRKSACYEKRLTKNMPFP